MMEAQVNSMFDARNEWLKKRLGKFTASQIYRLVKGSRGGDLTYIEEIVSEITSMQAKEDISTLRALEWGASNEQDAVQLFSELYGKDLHVDYFGVSEPEFFPYNEFSGGSPDGIVRKGNDRISVLEMKCPHVGSKHIRFLTASLNGASNDWLKSNNEDYFCQVQFNMMCASKKYNVPVKHAYFSSFDPRTVNPLHRLAVIEIYEDKEYQEKIDTKITEAVEKAAELLTLLG